MPKQKTVTANVETLKASVKSLFFVSLAFAPAALVTFFIGGTGALLAFYSLALFTLLAVVAGLFSEAMLVLGAGFASLFNTSTHGWRKATFTSMLWSVLAVGVVAIVAGNPWIAVVTAIVTLANWWAVQGNLFARFSKRADRSGTELQRDLAFSLLDYFAPAPDFRIKPKTGEPLVDENARMNKTLSHITRVEEVQPNVFKVDIRNNVAGKTDERLLKELEAVSANLGFYDWESVDEDPRAGFVTITVWLAERTDATSTVSGLLMWTQGDTK